MSEFKNLPTEIRTKMAIQAMGTFTDVLELIDAHVPAMVICVHGRDGELHEKSILCEPDDEGREYFTILSKAIEGFNDTVKLKETGKFTRPKNGRKPCSSNAPDMKWR